MKSTLNRELKAREADCSLTGETSCLERNLWLYSCSIGRSPFGSPEGRIAHGSPSVIERSFGCSPTRLETRSKEFSTCAKANGLRHRNESGLPGKSAVVKAFSFVPPLGNRQEHELVPLLLVTGRSTCAETRKVVIFARGDRSVEKSSVEDCRDANVQIAR